MCLFVCVGACGENSKVKHLLVIGLFLGETMPSKGKKMHSKPITEYLDLNTELKVVGSREGNEPEEELSLIAMKGYWPGSWEN